MKKEEQLERLKVLRRMMGKDYLDSLGVIKVMELAARTATLDGKGPEGREKAKALCGREMRLILGSLPMNAEYFRMRYDDSNGFDDREIGFISEQNIRSDVGPGLPLGRVVTLDTRSTEPLGMKE